MPQTKTISPANFDATLKAAGFKPANVAAHYTLPVTWSASVITDLAGWTGLHPRVFEYPISRATAMQCLVLYTENFGG